MFDVKELYQSMNDWLTEKSYMKNEIRNFEEVSEQGKNIEYVGEPNKKVTDYAKYIIPITIQMNSVKDVIVEKSGSKKKLSTGEITIELGGYLELDYEHRAEKKPMLFFIRAVFDQFIHKIAPEKLEPQLTKDVHELRDNLKAFLELYKHQA